MRIITAKIIDPTHLELDQPLSVPPGETILISVSDAENSERTWLEATRARFFDAYSEQDAIYDKL